MKQFLIVVFVFVATIVNAQDNLTIKNSSCISSFRMPPSYTWEPKDDITAPELAVALKTILPALTCRNAIGNGCDVSDAIEKLPPNIKRHFVRHDP